MTVLIPAYKPDEKLLGVISGLSKITDYSLVVVDDGSGREYKSIFNRAKELGATVLTHNENKGKGAALRTGFMYLSETNEKDGAVTADSDGQHTPEDIKRIAEYLLAHPGTFVLGGRDFRHMPFRSRLGNVLIKLSFRLATGLNISDTQTGLRGIPADMFDTVSDVEGERYEYEMNVLLKLKDWGVPYEELKISTIYISGNKSSHFRPLFDSLIVFFRVLIYILSSVLCTLIDYGLYTLLSIVLGISPSISYPAARVVSAALNYQINCRVVFGGKPTVLNAIGYAALVMLVAGLGSACVTYLSSHNINDVAAKVIVDCIMFVFNYFMQNKVIFRKKKKSTQKKA